MKPILILLLLLIPFVTAFPLQVNTTITLDWIGGNQAYLRTEAGDFLINANESAQSDSSYVINFTRDTYTNMTDFDIVMGKIGNMTKSCENISNGLDLIDTYYVELQSNWSRCNLDKQALMNESDYRLVSLRLQNDELQRQSDNISVIMNTCVLQRSVITKEYEDCNGLIGGLNQTITQEKTANSQKTMLVVILGIAVGIFVFQEIQKKQKAQPDEMSMLSNQ